MKFQVTFKTPDALDFAIDAVTSVVNTLELEEEKANLSEFAGKWVEWGESVTLEFDTDAGTCIVLPVK